MHIASLIFPEYPRWDFLSPHDVLAYHDTSVFNYKQFRDSASLLFNYKQFVYVKLFFCKRDLILEQWSLRYTQFVSVKAIKYIAGANF